MSKLTDKELILTQGAEPNTPPTGKVSIYFKEDGLPYYKNDNGDEIPFGSGGASVWGYISGDIENQDDLQAKLSEKQDVGDYVVSNDVLVKTNTEAFTPSADYHPATKKYVDDNAGSGGEPGADGREIELQTGVTHIQWRYVGDVGWTDLIAISEITGADGTNGTNGTNGADGVDGREVLLQKGDTHIQWKYTDDVSWTDLIALSELVGATGATGADGADGADGQGVPVGGTAGQVLSKVDETDFNTEWIDAPEGGGASYYDCTVGATGADYTTLNSAISAGHTKIEVINTPSACTANITLTTGMQIDYTGDGYMEVPMGGFHFITAGAVQYFKSKGLLFTGLGASYIFYLTHAFTDFEIDMRWTATAGQSTTAFVFTNDFIGEFNTIGAIGVSSSSSRLFNCANTSSKTRILIRRLVGWYKESNSIIYGRTDSKVGSSNYIIIDYLDFDSSQILYGLFQWTNNVVNYDNNLIHVKNGILHKGVYANEGLLYVTQGVTQRFDNVVFNTNNEGLIKIHTSADGGIIELNSPHFRAVNSIFYTNQYAVTATQSQHYLIKIVNPISYESFPEIFNGTPTNEPMVEVYNTSGKPLASSNQASYSLMYDRRIVYLKNNTGGTVDEDTFVISQYVNDESNTSVVVNVTTTVDHPYALGKALRTTSNGNGIPVLISGWVHKLKVNGTTDIARGDLLGTHSDSGILAKTTTVARAKAIALDPYTTDDSNGVIQGIVLPSLI